MFSIKTTSLALVAALSMLPSATAHSQSSQPDLGKCAKHWGRLDLVNHYPDWVEVEIISRYGSRLRGLGGVLSINGTRTECVQLGDVERNTNSLLIRVRVFAKGRRPGTMGPTTTNDPLNTQENESPIMEIYFAPGDHLQFVVSNPLGASGPHLPPRK